MARSSGIELINGEFTGGWKVTQTDMRHFQNLEGREEEKKILEGSIETVTLFTCYKIELYFSIYEKGTPDEEFRTTEKYVYDQVLYF